MMLKSDDVELKDLAPQLALALIMANEVYDEYGIDMVVTSANDSNHSGTSLHYSGQAVDLRTRTANSGDRQDIRDKVKAKLNVDFDVILESDHIHLEYQPKRRQR